MSAYLPWVESATDLELIADYSDYRRRSAFRTGFGNNETEEIPTTTPTTTTPSLVLFREWYPGINSESGKFQIYSLTPGQEAWYEMPRHLQEAGFNPGDCSGRRILVYREQMRLVDPNGTPGRAEYKATLYDEHIQNYTCISVKLENVLSRSPVLIWFRHHMDLLEGTGFKGGMGIDTPEEILKRIPLPKKYELTTEAPPLNGTATPIYKPGKHLEAIFVKDKVNRSGILNINLIIGFTFTGETKMNLRVYGYPIPRFRKPTTTTTTTRMTHRPRRRNKRKDRFERAREREAERRQIRVAGRNHIGYLQYL
ncbi:uncharacterized protein LOC114355258 [Ostrinia furnacalis]|uniref:uncharacterized protein LOC114355258 n=1 Tax=Ostrinia furnacalis TaxID=93504 RepID=UPI00103DA962|nr:uncharacterized protein LOC114355258 [Ostrinia furnacalis]